jgi:methionyl-tRNA formyltransferase
MKFGFITCVQLGLSCMEAIYDAGGQLALAVTLPDDKAISKSGRVYLDQFCCKHKVPLLKSPHVNAPEVVDAIKQAEIDWLFIVGWSQIAGARVLAAPRLGVFGMHPTLLPEGRGRAAIPWAILKDIRQTGVTLFKMDNGVDTGPIALQVEIPIEPTTDATYLYRAVEIAHIRVIHEVIPKIFCGKLTLRDQDNTKATVWPGRKPEDGEIDLTGSVFDAHRLIRAVTYPYPGAFFYQNARKIVVWSARLAPVDESDTSVDSDVRMLSFRDGVLLLDDYQIAD